MGSNGNGRRGDGREMRKEGDRVWVGKAYLEREAMEERDDLVS